MKYKVGDRVRILPVGDRRWRRSQISERYVGFIGKIIEVNISWWDYYIELNNGETLRVTEGEIELVEKGKGD